MLSHSVSVIIPIKNEIYNIDNCLDQLSQQTYPQDLLDVLFIDGESTDGTIEKINKFKSTNANLSIKVLTDKTHQRAAALNRGVKSSAGEIVVRVDARSIIPKDYIEKCVRSLLANNADNVGGLKKPLIEDKSKVTQAAIGLAMTHPFGMGNPQFRKDCKSGCVDSVYLGCFRRHVFERVGYFDEISPIISEDSDINYRIRKSGGKVYLDTDIMSLYLPREKLVDLTQLYFRYGGARAGFMLKWKDYTGYRQLLPPLFLFMLVILPIAGIFFAPCWYFWICLAFIYSAVDMIVSMAVAIKDKNIRLFIKLFPIFPIMHFSWATGLWRRLFQSREAAYWGY